MLVSVRLSIQVATTELMSKPGGFWALAYIIQSPRLLDRAREEIAFLDPDIDPKDYHQHLPFLTSCLSEVFRTGSATSSLRRVEIDTLLPPELCDGKRIMLKAGTELLSATAPTHMSTQHFGSEASLFKADRFLQREGAEKAPLPMLNRLVLCF